MQLPTHKHLATLAEYLLHESTAISRHEFRAGEIVAMAGGSGDHSLIVANVIGEARNALKGKPCRVYDSNLRIGITGTPLYTYPDMSIICGPIVYDPNDPTNQTATNPRVLVEVLSPSTEDYDRGKKFVQYQKLESLEEYVLISQDAPRVDIFRRQPDGTWVLSIATGIETRVRLTSVQAEVPLAEIYAGVEFAAK